jgi:phosphonate transport system substrate-binding protein
LSYDRAVSVGGDEAGFRFALPPSLGDGPVRTLARTLADVLYEAGFSTVVPTRSYEDLERALLEGRADAAWGPPIVCARVEDAGGHVALRAIRYGAVTYRAVLLCRADDPIDLRAEATLRQRRAVWVDRWSMAGYVLPRHHLRTLGLDPASAFEREDLLGSYAACLDAVLELEADVTATFANRRGLGYHEICGGRADELRTLGYTDESPNDGVVIGPKVAPAAADALGRGLRALIARPASLAVLAETFRVDGFDRPAPGTYRPLLALL